MKRLFILLLALFLVFTMVSCDNFWSSSSSSSNNNGGGTDNGGNGGSGDGGGSASTPDYLCFAATGASTIAMALTGTVTPLPELEYSTDGSTWTAFEIGTTTVDLADGEKVYFRGDNTAFASVADNYVKFVMTGSIAASGNIMSLLDKKCASKTIPADNCFKLLFWSCNSLTSAPELPATTLTTGCYASMFQGCTSLTTAPELPATTLADACYAGMFNGCISLTTAPELPANTLTEGCYASMFNNCSSLAASPDLPSTTLADDCYTSMFAGCTSLTSAPELPATTLAVRCYMNMFYHCENLTTAPELPATTLVEECYAAMFNGCSGLTSIRVHFTDWNDAEYSTTSWVSGVSATGTFYYKSGSSLDTSTGINRVPEHFTPSATL